MNEVEEKLKLTIEEEDDNKEYKIKTYDLEITIPDSGMAEMITGISLNGFLEVIIIDVSNQTDLYIALDGCRDHPIYEEVSVRDKRFLPLRMNARSFDNERLNYSQERWPMADPLYVKVKGIAGEIVKIQVRYC